jgi:hypothetical protein
LLACPKRYVRAACLIALPIETIQDFRAPRLRAMRQLHVQVNRMSFMLLAELTVWVIGPRFFIVN